MHYFIFGHRYTSDTFYIAVLFFAVPFILNSHFLSSTPSKLRKPIIFGLLFLCLISYLAGKIRAETIANSESGFTEFNQNNTVMKFQYLGHVNGYEFFINQKTIVKIQHMP